MTDTTQDPFAAPGDAAPPPPPARPDYTSLSLHKILLVAGLAITTILPNMFISNLIEERETRQEGVRAEFARNWGPEQSLYSPTLIIPYQTGDRPRQYVKVAPARLDLNATLNPQERKRGLFHATVYDSKVEMSGAFVVPAEARLRDFVADKDGRFIWNEAAIAFGAQANLTGLRPTDNIVIDGTETQWLPCLEAIRQELACKGVSMVLASVPLTPALTGSTRVQFKSGVSLRGTGSFTVQFAGKELFAKFASSWPS
jgi:inner membrane protein